MICYTDFIANNFKYIQFMEKHSKKQSIKYNYQSVNNNLLIKILKDEYHNKKIDNTINIIQEIKKRKLKLHDNDRQLIDEIEQMYQKISGCLIYLNEPAEDWRHEKFSEQITLSSKIINKSEIMIRFDGLLPINIFNLSSMIYQTSLYSQWVPFCDQSKDLKTVGLAEKIAYIKFKLPFISNKQGFFYGQGIDRISFNNTILIYCEGITGKKQYQDRFKISLEKDKDAVQFDLKFFFCEISMVNKEKFHLRSFSHMDIQMSFIPQFILSFFTKKIGHFLFNKLIKSANDVSGTEWEKKIKQDPEKFYKWLRQRVQQWETKLQN